ncbi:MAG: DAK2 domain-containing protein [Nitriliruptoraceae bacterium]|nr:DAK2 domain-containing protein [Nitriliruptoraceae bacterium]
MGTVAAPLSARELPALFTRVHGALAARREAIDALNVFPVPDGDTGTNMTATVAAGLEALHGALAEEPRPTGDDLARRVIRGAVGGARGNSGVIISQVLRAVVEEITGHFVIDAPLYAAALERARDLAYDAVGAPVEGTILTALHVAAHTARQHADAGEDLPRCSAATCAAVAIAVADTPTQLEILAEAGVVDAGARGFEVLLSAVHGHLTGQEAPVATDDPPGPFRAERAGGRVHQPFEVQYLLDAGDEVAAPLRDRLAAIGDSVVVVTAGDLLNVHVHTGQVGPAIEFGIALGHVSDIEVTHLGDQVAAVAASRPRALGVVAVLHGDGAQALATAVGAVVVDGMAGALPSVEDLHAAVRATGAATVLLLPGHPNVLPAARQLVALLADDVPVEVVEGAISPPAVLAGLAVVDLDADPVQLRTDVRQAAGAVRAGEVVDAVRHADTPIGPIRAGQPLGVVEGRVIAADDDVFVVLEAVARYLDVASAELVTIVHGAASSGPDRAQAVAVVEAATDAEVEVIDGGVRPARFWVGVE